MTTLKPNPPQPYSLSSRQPFFHSLWLFYFISLPFLYLDASLEAFALRKTLFMVLVGLQLAWTTLKPPERSFPKPQTLDVLVFLVLGLRFFSAVLGELRDGSLLFSVDTLLFETSLVLFYLLMRREPPSYNWLIRLCQGLILSQVFVGILQLLHLAWVAPLSDGRLSAQYFHPNVLGILSVALLAILASEPRLKAVALNGFNQFILALGALTVVFTGSRNALVALLAMLLILKPVKLKFLLIPLILLPLLWWARSQSHPIESYRASIETQIKIRQAVLGSSIQGILQHPLGVGAGLFSSKIHPYINDDLHKVFPNPMHHSLNKAHNFILELVFESGWLMFPVLLYGLFLVIQLPFSGPKAAILALVFCSMFSVFLNYPTGQIFLALLLAMGQKREEF